MELNIKVTGQMNKINTWIKNIETLYIELPNAHDALAKHAQQVMVDTINNTGRNPKTGNLANSINIEKAMLSKGISQTGIGYIPTLPKYWYVVNYGTRFDTGEEYIPPATLGSFVGNPSRPVSSMAGTGVGKQSFRSSNSGFLLMPSNPIQPKNYIEKALNELLSIWKVHYIGKVKKVLLRK